MNWVRAGFFFLTPIAISAKCGSSLLSAQDTFGIYFSARGFTFEPYYRKAILSAETELSGKALFLLALADSIQKHLAMKYPFLWINLHRYPQSGNALQQLPPQWKGILHYLQLSLYATKERAVFSESNRIRTEPTYRLSFRAEGAYITARGRQPFSYRGDLPAHGWKAALLQQIVQQAESLLKN